VCRERRRRRRKSVWTFHLFRGEAPTSEKNNDGQIIKKEKEKERKRKVARALLCALSSPSRSLAVSVVVDMALMYESVI
jgi:hypothetical protein